jgi:AraC-like DNA-binding protein
MDRGCENMDEICVWLEKLLGWVDRCGAPAIPWAGPASGGFYNPPAPHLEVVYLAEGRVSGLRVGDRPVSLPVGHFSLHSVHFGNFSERRSGGRSWCAFFDVGGEREFRKLHEAPLFGTAKVSHPGRLEEAFKRLTAVCRRHGTASRGYLERQALYDPTEHEAGGGTAAVFVKAATLELLATLLEQARAASGTGPEVVPPAVRDAAEYMALNFSRSALSLGNIAAAAGLSIDHFGRLFKSYAEETPMNYLRRVRVREARFLLEHSGLLVKEVAAATGFTDPFHFSRAFRSETGQSPRAYRAKKRAANR